MPENRWNCPHHLYFPNSINILNLEIVKKPKTSLTTTWNVLGRECLTTTWNVLGREWYSLKCVAIRTAREECFPRETL